jgi:hypothetical protein
MDQQPIPVSTCVLRSAGNRPLVGLASRKVASKVRDHALAEVLDGSYKVFLVHFSEIAVPQF